MSSYLSQKELVSSIEKNINAMESGSFSLTEMERHFEQVRELYERTLILRYKAFEKNSSITIVPVEIEEPIADFTPNVEAAEENPSEVEISLLTKDEEVMPSKMEELTPTIEFDLFATVSDKEEEVQPTSNFTQEEVVLNATQDEILQSHSEIDHIENSISYEVSASDEEVQTEESNPFNTIEYNEEEEDLSSTTEPFSNSAQIEEEAPIQHTINETPAYELPTMDAPNEVSTAQGAFYDKVFKIYNDAKNQFGYYSLPALSGSFGLNERLMYINELFDGSSESFSEAVKQLDTKKELVNAAQYIQELAQTNNWEIESDTVEEFIHKVGRRFA